MDVRYALSILTLVTALSVPVLSASAQGDSCVTALVVTHGLHHADGPSTGEASPGCGAGGTHADWYKYIATFTGTINITSCSSGNEPSDDTYLNVFTGDCGALTCVGFNDDMGNNNCPGYFFATYLDIAVTEGETYFIVWSNVFNSDDFDWNLTECFGTVQGNTYNDANSNGAQDAGEMQVGVMLAVNPGGHFVYASQNPYSFCTEAGTYTISVPNPPLYYTAVPATHDYTVATQGQLVTNMDFAFQPIPGMYDGRADIWGWNPWIGNETTYGRDARVHRPDDVSDRDREGRGHGGAHARRPDRLRLEPAGTHQQQRTNSHMDGEQHGSRSHRVHQRDLPHG